MILFIYFSFHFQFIIFVQPNFRITILIPQRQAILGVQDCTLVKRQSFFIWTLVAKGGIATDVRLSHWAGIPVSWAWCPLFVCYCVLPNAKKS